MKHFDWQLLLFRSVGGVKNPEVQLSHSEGQSASARTNSLCLCVSSQETPRRRVSLLPKSCSSTFYFFTPATYFHFFSLSYLSHLLKSNSPSASQLCFDTKHMCWNDRASVLCCLTVQCKCITAVDVESDSPTPWCACV